MHGSYDCLVVIHMHGNPPRGYTYTGIHNCTIHACVGVEWHAYSNGKFCTAVRLYGYTQRSKL